MKKLAMPNVRKMIVPDSGFILVDADLKGADARVVAWEADDEPLKAAFRKDVDIHAFNAETLWPTGHALRDYKLKTPEGHYVFPELDPKRHKAKTAIHAVDYGCKERTLASHLNCTTGEAAIFIMHWFNHHPGILAWQQLVARRLYQSQSITNVWGYRHPYFDRAESLLPKALAWIGQSTTAIAINKLIVNLVKCVPEVEVLLQTHDSVTFQVKQDRFSELWPAIKAACTVTAPYKDPLVMPVEFAVSDKSWGDVKEIKE